MSLEDYGFDDFFREAFAEIFEDGLEPGRVVLAAGGSYRLATEGGERVARLSGRFRHQVLADLDYPAVGDWVVFRATGSRIEGLLPRRTKLSRMAAGKKPREQVVAANLDRVLVLMGLDSDYNPRRLERFLATVWESGASPLVVLTKLDLCPEAEERVREIEEIAPGAEVLASSAKDGRGIEEISARLRPRETSALVGSSGVGKSTLINLLLGGVVQKTREVRAHDSRGMHTTSLRELFRLEGGALLVDNPGVREIQLLGDEESLERTFEDVARIARECRFGDCTHRSEPGCAVAAAVASGSLPVARLESFRALERERLYLERRRDESAKRLEKRKWRRIHRELRRSGRHRRT